MYADIDTLYRRHDCRNPDCWMAHNNLGVDSEPVTDRSTTAIVQYQKALKINPDYAEAHNNLGLALAARGHFDEALAHFQKALEIKPNYANARQNYNAVLAHRKGVLREFAARRELTRSSPRDANLLNETAWTLATNPNASVRDGAEAVELAQRAVKLSGGREPAILDTLAAAYAEAGRFADAVQTAQKAIDLATQQNKPTLADSLGVRIKLYQAGSTYRTGALPPPPP